MTGVSPNDGVGRPDDLGVLQATRMPSSDSSKSMALTVGSNGVPGVLHAARVARLDGLGRRACGRRRSRPAPGAGCRSSRHVTCTPDSSVVVRLVPVAPPGRNSCTVPATVTASPTWAVGALRGEGEQPLAGAGVAVRLGGLEPEAVGSSGRSRRPRPGPAAVERRDVGRALDLGDRRAGGSVGATVQAGAAVAAFSGVGAPAAKSAPFWSVSTHGLPRASEVVLVRPGCRCRRPRTGWRSAP